MSFQILLVMECRVIKGLQFPFLCKGFTPTDKQVAKKICRHCWPSIFFKLPLTTLIEMDETWKSLFLFNLSISFLKKIKNSCQGILNSAL